MRIGLTGDAKRDLPSIHPDRKRGVVLTFPARIAGKAQVVESTMTGSFAVGSREPDS